MIHLVHIQNYKILIQILTCLKKKTVQFWKRDAKTITSAKYHAPHLYKTVEDKLNLRYYYIKYACIHGGQEFRSKNKQLSSKNKRNHSGTYKQNCNASITVGLKNGLLIIKNILNDHNHEIPTIEIFKQLPKQRRLTDDNKTNIRNLMKLKVNKKLLEAHLIQQTGNVILLKDLSNIHMLSSSNGIKNGIQEIMEILTNKYHCTVDIHSEDNKLREVLFMDGTYKLINIRCPVYVMCVENSFGKTDVVGIGILMTETIESINWLIQKYSQWYGKKNRVAAI
ncbi:hypothetical protein ABEB36_011039 [Hypothenemus hampei]|uniref:Protein FAR1-RELATED SEQUENCE n=1 Tax=Hypothenemus hampei TaxID=57062 RepID=A0ABD1EDZ1_HYPHA